MSIQLPIGGDFPPSWSWKDKPTGTKVGGTIVDIREPVDGETDLNGRPVRNYVFQLESVKRPGERVSLWVQVPSRLLSAISKACDQSPALGAFLEVELTGKGVPKNPNHKPPNLFEAVYEAPARSVSLEDF